MYKLGRRSKANLKGVHVDLQAVVRRALEIGHTDFSVVEGLRTEERQAELVADGKSQTMRSYHLADINGVSNAVDLYPWVNGKTSHKPRDYKLLAKAMFRASQELGVVIEWGGFWRNFEDKPHWQRIALKEPTATGK